ncbi:hypothetical protein BOTBODRAFT_590042 [Botryobasidium botryosum FD-172 SS1]|uniref:Uncharacterized protein n=1 Tax=Botryobasidium botryosum (strain FD-172 SS1) TaxID=930990 RepID=A0A067LXF6_BOTB1|nr:hypothetical protein BOTBODRAFT_590042 [Botryobasidium botryosum FD-172 SS1]
MATEEHAFETVGKASTSCRFIFRPRNLALIKRTVGRIVVEESIQLGQLRDKTAAHRWGLR